MGLYIIMMGVQGAGKGIQAGVISQEYGIPQVSTGDLFRAMKTREDDLAREVQEIMKTGGLVPDDVTCRMVEDRLSQEDAKNGVILDGFPRNNAQVEWLNEHLAAKGEKVTAVLLLELDLYTAFKRAFGRIKDAETGDSPNIYSNTDGIAEWKFEDHPDKAYPPRLVATLESNNPIVRRPDDANAHSVIVRIDTYMAETMPLVETYDKQGLVVRIDANQSIKAVTKDVLAAIEERKA